MNIARIGNKYLADEEPWKIIKEDPERVKTVIFISLHISSVLAIVSEPFIPFTSKKIKNIMTSVKDSNLHSFSIPLLVDINSGDNWGQLH